MIDMLPGIDCTTSALTAERIRLDVISQNIANANTTRNIDGKPYQRQQVTFETALRRQETGDGGGALTHTVKVAHVENDQRPPVLVYNPAHPDADHNGMVAMPAINLSEEMADLIVASRVFEANLAVVKNSRSMTIQTLSIGKRS